MIHIEVPGVGATVQDGGRWAHLRAGVPMSGPADPFAFAAAQALVGNHTADAAIEVVGLPFAFHCDDARLVSVTGREVSLTVRDRMPGWGSVFVRAGDTVTVAGTPRTRYAYVAVSGGIASEMTLGSRAAYPRAGLGAVLRIGHALALGAPRRGAQEAGATIAFEYAEEIAAMVGPHRDRFDDATLDRLFAAAFTVSAQSDRQGVRLAGPRIAPDDREILTCGVVAGAIQVPRGGEPIVLLADHQTTGGYPVIATVIEADLGRVAQRAAGESVRFYRVERDDALDRALALRAVLASA